MDFRQCVLNNSPRVIEGQIKEELEAARLCMEDPGVPWTGGSSSSPDFRLAGNVFASRDLLASCLGICVPELTERILEAMEGPLGYEIVQKPDQYRGAHVKDLPIPTYFKGDGGPYITSGIFHSGYENVRNLSFHRMMYLGGDRFAVRVVPRHMKKLLEDSQEDGKGLRAVVSIGADPASLIAASCSMAFGVDEYTVSSALNRMTTGRALRTFSPLDDGLVAPVGTEIVLVGEFTGELAPEGPFVDITSTRDLSGMEPGEPVFIAKRCLVRKDPIMHVLLPGGHEHYLLMGLPKEPSILQSVRKVLPGVSGVRLTEGGCGWLHGIVSIEKRREGDGKNAIMAAFTGHPSMKRVIAVDHDVDIFNDKEVEWALATRFQAKRDLVIVDGATGSTLDPSAGRDRTTSKMGMDATRPAGSGEEFERVDKGPGVHI